MTLTEQNKQDLAKFIAAHPNRNAVFSLTFISEEEDESELECNGVELRLIPEGKTYETWGASGSDETFRSFEDQDYWDFTLDDGKDPWKFYNEKRLKKIFKEFTKYLVEDLKFKGTINYCVLDGY